jgi:predicted metal-dependent phosphoesterase TrpH
LGRDCPFYVSKVSKSPQEVVTRLRELGAVPVLAHPGVTRVDEITPSLVQGGLLGIEVYHADHSAQDRERYAALAASLGILATGGTDFHGTAGHNPPPGSIDIPETAIRALLAADPHR